MGPIYTYAVNAFNTARAAFKGGGGGGGGGEVGHSPPLDFNKWILNIITTW